MRTACLTIVIATAFVVAAPASAEQIAVPYSDLNLASEKGRNLLERRIDRAAREVCGVDEAITGTRSRPQDRLDC